MLHHPDTLRPGPAATPFLAGSPPPLEDDAIVARMATVILRQAGDGQSTEIRHFREAEETRALSDDEIARHIGAARRRADRKVIRQDAVEANGGVEDYAAQDAISERTDEELIGIVCEFAAPQLSDDALCGLALEAGLRPAAIARIWDRLRARLATNLVSRPAPRLGAIAARANGRGTL